MNIRENTMIEKKIMISETDMVNEEVYKRNKAEYDKAIQEFRASCL